MDISTTITSVLVALLGGGGGAALIKFVLEYIDKKRGNTLDQKITKSIQDATKPLLEEMVKHEEKIDELIECDSKFDAELKEIRLDTTRTQLLMLMEHQPHNYDTILKVAERYFCQLGGDWYCTSLFQDWAKKEHVNIPDNIYQATLHHE